MTWLPLTMEESFWVRYLLSRELWRMKRPDVSDLLIRAGFEMQGRHLVIAIPEVRAWHLAPVLSAAVLNCGLPVDTATVCR